MDTDLASTNVALDLSSYINLYNNIYILTQNIPKKGHIGIYYVATYNSSKCPMGVNVRRG